ncbi:hypothetical protein FB45DRAFT_1037551 [Roridomyces roridus]|uniref:Uncharacterized protein n=1 Tax=Roridomyces roridus TaxID=1738132 RepID=A0AAD7B5D8_9AGAR|nr:hypothetical protein FB45DRAFT_1037551 [Roridomyces roridus]
MAPRPTYIDIFCYFALVPPTFTVLARGANTTPMSPTHSIGLPSAASRHLSRWHSSRPSGLQYGLSKPGYASDDSPDKAATPTTTSDSSSSTLLAFLTLKSTPIVTAALLPRRDRRLEHDRPGAPSDDE